MSADWSRRRDDVRARWNRPRSAPARKDRRRWCRGKVGVEHQSEVVLDPQWGRVCRESRIGKWEQHTSYKTWVTVGSHWSCCHIEQCVECGKKLRHLTPEECPLRTAVRRSDS